MGALLLGFAALLAPPQPSVSPTLPPIEQCAGDASFGQFRYELGRAVARRDRDSLLGLFAPDVLLSFGGTSGREELLKTWEFDATEPDNIWGQMEKMLGLGCARAGGSRVIPSLIMQVEEHEDEDEARALLLPGATLYESAGIEASNSSVTAWTLATVTSRVADWGTGVRLPDGREGYVPDQFVQEPTGHRLVVEKRGGKWLITALVAGD